MTAILQVPAWHERALCRQVDPELFFPEKGTGLSQLQQARRICARCEVKPECRQDAIERDERFGVWGGTSEAERRRMRRERREASC